jgi:hypothetical protein
VHTRHAVILPVEEAPHDMHIAMPKELAAILDDVPAA